MHKKPTLLVIGHARHGKDTVTEYLAAKLGLTYVSSSEVAAYAGIFDDIILNNAQFTVDALGIKAAQSYLLIPEIKNNFRSEMFAAISDFNSTDKTNLAKLILADNNIYCGMRNREELLACKKAGLFDLIIFVDSSLRLYAESAESMTIKGTDADIIIENNGTLKQLEDKLEALVTFIHKMQT